MSSQRGERFPIHLTFKNEVASSTTSDTFTFTCQGEYIALGDKRIIRFHEQGELSAQTQLTLDLKGGRHVLKRRGESLDMRFPLEYERTLPGRYRLGPLQLSLSITLLTCELIEEADAGELTLVYTVEGLEEGVMNDTITLQYQRLLV